MNILTSSLTRFLLSFLLSSFFFSLLQAATPTAPSGLLLEAGDKSVTLSWQDNASDENGYKIFRDGVLIALVPANSTSYHDSALLAKHTYTYTVKATQDSTQDNEMLLDEEEENNGVCNGELLQALEGIYQAVNYSGSGITHANSDQDHYHFKPSVSGTLDINLTSSNESLGFIVGSSCGDDDYGRSENSINHTRTFHIPARQYIALRVHDWSANNENYSLAISFTPDETHTTPPIVEDPTGHPYKNNLSDEASGTISTPESVVNDPSVATVKGSLSINQGKANYHLPIPLPPGRAGMEPKLSLDYSSQGGNGYLGKGWGLGGLSVITRCPSTKAIDGTVKEIQLDSSDNYCLDGQRLIDIGNGAYKTELNSYSKIIAQGSNPHGPESWKVYTKSGLIYEYGVEVEDEAEESLKNHSKIIANFQQVNTSKSRALGNTKVVISWAVSSIKDRTSDGNVISYFYNVDASNTERYIDHINYSGGSIHFDYDATVDRYDTISGYFAGAKYNITKLLVRLSIRDIAGIEVENFNLDYLTTTRFTQLSKIHHFVGGVALQPLDIGWSEEDFSEESYPITEGIHANIEKVGHIADFDNDGMLSIINKQDNYTQVEADIDGDGYLDSVLYDGNIWVNSGHDGINGAYDKIAENFAQGLVLDSHFITFTDINNDGKSDIIAAAKEENGGGVYLWIGTGSSFSDPVEILEMTEIKQGDTPMFVVDMNKDGLPDIVHFASGHVEIAYNDNGDFGDFIPQIDLGTSFTRAEGWTGLISYDDGKMYPKYPRRFADVNGDGLVDIVGFSNAGTVVAINGGNGFEESYVADRQLGYDAGSGWNEGFHKRIFADMNGDGYVDIVAFGSDDTYILYGNGKKEDAAGFTLSTTIHNFSRDQGFGVDDYRSVADVNNDGTLDIIAFKDHILYKAISSKRFLAVTRFNNHKDQSLKLLYASLVVDNEAGKEIYQMGYHYADMITLTPAMQVVSAVEAYERDALLPNSIDYYYYSGYRVNKERGSLGFAAVKNVTKTNHDGLDIHTVSHYKQQFPYIGMLANSYVGFDLDILHPRNQGELISATVNSYTARISHAAGVYDVFVAQEIQSNYLQGTGSSSYNTYSSDGLGNLLTLSAKTYLLSDPSQAFTTSTTNTYEQENTADWIIGRLSSSTATFTSPDASPTSKHSTFSYEPSTGLLSQENIEPTQTKHLSKSYTYDNYGNKVSETLSGYELPQGMTTTYEYSAAYAHRFLTKATNPKGFIQSNSYNPSTGSLTSTTDANGNTITTSYDAIGKKIKVHSSKDNLTMHYAHTWDTIGLSGLYSVVEYGDNKPFQRTIYDKDAKVLYSYHHDRYGKVVFTQRNTYSNDGTLDTSSLPFYDGGTPLIVTHKYDKYKRNTDTITPAASGSGTTTSTLTYEGLTTTLSQEGLVKSTTTDARGKTIMIVDAKGSDKESSIHYNYYADGKLKSTTDAKGNSNSFDYDILGHKLSSTDVDMGVWGYDHNALGQLIKIGNPNNQISFLKYDVLGRMTTKYIRGYTYIWDYDDNTAGNKGTLRLELKRVSSDDTLRYKKRYHYDDRARVINTTETMYVNDVSALENYTTSYSYYANNRLKDLTYPNNLTIRHYYKNGALEKIKDADTQETLYAVTNTNVFGKVTSATMAGSLNQIYGYNQVGLLTSQSTRDAMAEKVNLTYTYDNRGNLKTKHDKYIGAIGEGLKETYNYDSQNRLSEVSIDSSLLANNEHLLNYTYNKIGNLTQKVDTTISYKTDKAHQIDKVKGVTYHYDNNGNLLSDDRHTFNYDPTDKMISLTQEGQTTNFDYASDGHRYLKNSGDGYGGYTHYVGKLYESTKTDHTTQNKIEKNFLYFNGSLIAIKQRAISSQIKAPTLNYLHHDNLGNVIAMTDESNSIIDRRSYTPFGEIRKIPYNEQLNPDNIPTLIERLNSTTNRVYTRK